MDAVLRTLLADAKKWREDRTRLCDGGDPAIADLQGSDDEALDIVRAFADYEEVQDHEGVQRERDRRALDQLAHLLGHGLANDGTWDGGADHLDAIAEIVARVREIPEHTEADEEDEILCTSTDPTNHQGDTCPVHESQEVQS